MNLHQRRVLYTKLGKLKASERSRYIRGINERELLALSEIFRNFLTRKLICDKLTDKRVKKYHSIVHVLAKKGTPSTTRKRVLSSARGGHLLTILLPLATKLLGNLLST